MKPVFIKNPRLNRNRLSSNPAAVPYLEQYPDEIHWPMLSLNPDAIHLLAQHPDKIHWYTLSKNPNALPILEQHMDKVVWETIAFNPNVIRILDPNPNLPLTWSPKTHTSMDELAWSWLCRNKSAVPFLEKHISTGITFRLIQVRSISWKRTWIKSTGLTCPKTLPRSISSRRTSTRSTGIGCAETRRPCISSNYA